MCALAARSAHDALSDEQLREAIDEANIPVLELVLVQLTGDRRWLRDPYRPTRNEGLGDNPSGGLDPERQAEVRAAARQAIARWRDGDPPALPDPSPAELAEMLGVSMGEAVAPEYGPMIATELGLQPPPAAPRQAEAPPGFQVLVIGAGVSGIAAAVQLHRAGIPYRVVERNPQLGGTWYDNRYPGCGVDTPSPIYSYSFAPREWSRYFAGRDEVLRYLHDVAAEADVLSHTSLCCEVRSAAYDAERQCWRVQVEGADGVVEVLEPSVVISAVGVFSTPRYPEVPGLESFTGDLVHTARWPADGIELDGRDVAVIGSGASAMQVVPAIAPRVRSLAVVQRSPQWIAPFPYLHQEIPEPVRRLAAELPLYRTWARLRWSWVFNDRLHSALQKDPGWPHPERAVSAANDAHRRAFTRYLSQRLADRPDLRDQMTPDYPPFGKRILLDNGWFDAITRDNVRLVTDRLAEVDATGLTTASGEHLDVDAIVCATGFDAVRFLDTIEVRGRSGESLRDAWDDDDARAYLGTAVPDFPNLFILYGPNIQPGHGGSLVGLAEMQASYVVELLQRMLAAGLGALEVRRPVWSAYNERVDEAHENMVWTHPGMTTYYRNARGRVVVPGPFRNIDLWHRLRRADLDDYRGEPAVRRIDTRHPR